MAGILDALAMLRRQYCLQAILVFDKDRQTKWVEPRNVPAPEFGLGSSTAMNELPEIEPIMPVAPEVPVPVKPRLMRPATRRIDFDR